VSFYGNPGIKPIYRKDSKIAKEAKISLEPLPYENFDVKRAV